MQGQEQRIFDRFPVRFPAKIKDAREDFGETLQLRDASAIGAKFQARDRYYLNDSLVIELSLPDGMGPMNLRGQVIWVKEKGPSLWDIGLKFHEISLMHLSRLYKFTTEPLFQ